jgi:hypothetical protein
MRSLRSVAVLGSVAVLLASAVFATPAAAAGTKVEVCHLGDDGGFHLISISQHALDAHLAHGDGMVGDGVPGMDGFVFDENCSPVEAPDSSPLAAGCYGSATAHSDFYFSGDFGQVPNVTFFQSYNGLCDGDPYTSTQSIVIADDLPGAVTECSALGLIEQLGEPLNDGYYGYTELPVNTWLCKL